MQNIQESITKIMQAKDDRRAILAKGGIKIFNFRKVAIILSIPLLLMLVLEVRIFQVNSQIKQLVASIEAE